MIYQIRPGFAIRKDGLVYSGGQSVDLTPGEFELHKLKLEGVTDSPLPPNTVNPGTHSSSTIQISIPAETWSQIALISEVRLFQVFDSQNLDLTDSFEYRQYQGQWQIYSLLPQNNLKIILNP